MSSGTFLIPRMTQYAPSIGTPYDLLTDTLKLALFEDVPVPDFTADTVYGAAPWNTGELVSAGYSAGGVTLTTVTLTVAGGLIVLKADPIALAGITSVAGLRYGLIYSSTAADALIYCCDFGASYPLASPGPFNVNWDPAGIVAWTP